MNLYRAEYHCDLSNPKETMDTVYFVEINYHQAQQLIEQLMEILGKVEDPTGLIFKRKYEELPNQLLSCMVMYADDIHENMCHQYLIIAAEEMPEAESIADVESWNHILDMGVVLEEPEDEPEIEEWDGADDAD